MPSLEFTIDCLFAGAVAIRNSIASRAISASELLKLYAAQFEKVNPQINAIVMQDFEGAFAKAHEADKALANGVSWGPLHGVPMTVKESYDVVGFPTTWGMGEFEGRTPSSDSSIVRRLSDAGAIVFGKSNVAEGLVDWQTANQLYGLTKNPWNLDRTPGGSSGGAAAAVATGLTALEIGSDIGGSLRNPAHYCGVFSHKPTFGIVPQDGETFPGTHAAADLSCNGPIARSAEDLALVLDLIAGPSNSDSPYWSIRLPESSASELRDFRVAVLLDIDQFPVSSELRAAMLQLSDYLASTCAKVRVNPTMPASAPEMYELGVSLLRAATSSRVSSHLFKEQQGHASRCLADDKSYLALMSRSTTMTHRRWLQLNEARTQLIRKWEAFFDSYDVLLCPAAASVAPLHNAQLRYERQLLIDGNWVPEPDQLLWAVMSGACYLPSTVAPIAISDEGLPIGVQIASGRYRDKTTLRFARLLERQYHGFVRPPMVAQQVGPVVTG